MKRWPKRIPTAAEEDVVVGNNEGPPKCLARVRHKMFAPQWHIRGEARSRLHVSPPWVEGLVHDQIVVVVS